MKQVYFAIEDLGLNDTQRAVIIDELRSLGPSRDAQPARLCHWRMRLDGRAAIFEALFNEDSITIASFRERLRIMFGVYPDGDVVLKVFGERPTAVATFSYSGVDYLRVAIFGYAGTDWPTWAESGAGARDYLLQHQDQWEVE